MPIQIKTPAEIDSMRASGKILATVLHETSKMAKPGITTFELDQFAENLIREMGGKPAFKGYRGFPGTLCTAIDSVIVHGIPKKDEFLKEGDLFTIDCGVIYENMYSDAARTIAIGEVNELKKNLIRVANEALAKALEVAQPGTPLNFIGKTIQNVVEAAGFEIVKDLTGHGIGKRLHEDPIVLNYWEGEPGPILTAGMTLAIEPIFAAGGGAMRTLEDNWTLVTADNSPAIQVEETILITENSNEILTKI